MTAKPLFPLAIQRRHRLAEALKSVAAFATIDEAAVLTELHRAVTGRPVDAYTEVIHGMLIGATAGALTAMLRTRRGDPCLYTEPNGRAGEADYRWAIASGGCLLTHGGAVVSAKTEIAVLLRALEVCP